MCGIIGYVGYREAAPVLLQGLKRLEYRGYDSAGVAILARDDGRRDFGPTCQGKLGNLANCCATIPCRDGRHRTYALGHTRAPCDENAHPHRSGEVVVIHNGIVENYLELREELSTKGRTFSSETDTEVISHLIDQLIQEGLSFTEATRATVQRLHGSFAIVVLCEQEPKLSQLRTPPLSSSVWAKVKTSWRRTFPHSFDYTRQVAFLDDGEMAEVTRAGVVFSDFQGQPIERTPRRITWDALTAQKGGYKHFLLKEIHEQPQALIDTMRGRILAEDGNVSLGELDADTRTRSTTSIASPWSPAVPPGMPASRENFFLKNWPAYQQKSIMVASFATATPHSMTTPLFWLFPNPAKPSTHSQPLNGEKPAVRQRWQSVMSLMHRSLVRPKWWSTPMLVQK